MTDLHPIYVGHFAHDGKFVKTTIDPETGLAAPRLKTKLTEEELDQLASVRHISPDDREAIRELGYVILELTRYDPIALEFVTELVNHLSCDLVDRTFRVVPLSEIGHC